MEAVGRKRARHRPRRAFTPEFKAQIVELVRSGARTVPEVVSEFDLVGTSVRQWVAQAEAVALAEADARAGASGDGLSVRERVELAELRRENKRLKEDNEVLKRATAFFAREIR